MANLTLNLTVTNGTSLLGIIFKLFKGNNEIPLVDQVRNGSFTYDFDLEENEEYNLYIVGTNSLSVKGNTNINLVYNGVKFHGNFKNPTNRKGNGYFIMYSFDTK
jgi:hypothetical protein